MVHDLLLLVELHLVDLRRQLLHFRCQLPDLQLVVRLYLDQLRQLVLVLLFPQVSLRPLLLDDLRKLLVVQLQQSALSQPAVLEF